MLLATNRIMTAGNLRCECRRDMRIHHMDIEENDLTFPFAAAAKHYRLNINAINEKIARLLAGCRS